MAQIADSTGVALFSTVPTASYLAQISVRQTGTDAAASPIWAIRNPLASSKTVYLRRLRATVIFDGTAAAGTDIGYELIRFSGGDPSTGTTIPRVKKRTAYAASQILDADAQFKVTALTMTGVSYDTNGAFAVCKLPISVTNGQTPWLVDFASIGGVYEPFELAAGEGIAIRAHVTSVAGQGISGFAEWDER